MRKNESRLLIKDTHLFKKRPLFVPFFFCARQRSIWVTEKCLSWEAVSNFHSHKIRRAVRNIFYIKFMLH